MATWDIDLKGTVIVPIVNMVGDQAMGRYFDVGSPEEDRATPWAGGPSSVTYFMRGFDQNIAVNDYVTWTSTEVDADASEYSGPGPVVDIIILS